jgi:type II secretory pathway pseudopilin PulG
VSLAVIGIVGAAFTVFLVGTDRISHGASVQDTAAQVALDAMERARGMRGAALLAGRAECDSAHPCAAPVSDQVRAYLGSQARRWDAVGTGSVVLPTPADPERVVLDGLSFSRYNYLARCWQTAATDGSTGSRPCTESAAATSYPAAYVRLVVAVTWNGQECAGGICAYATATLLSSSATDPYLEG